MYLFTSACWLVAAVVWSINAGRADSFGLWATWTAGALVCGWLCQVDFAAFVRSIWETQDER